MENRFGGPRKNKKQKECLEATAVLSAKVTVTWTMVVADQIKGIFLR